LIRNLILSFVLYINAYSVKHAFDIELIAFPEGEWNTDALGQPALLVVVCTEATSRASDLAYLEKVLESVQLAPVAQRVRLLVAEGEQDLPLFTLLNRWQCTTALLFGLTPAAAGLQSAAQRYQPLKVAGKTLLFCDSLSVIRQAREQGDKTRAMALWQAMKQIL
jgi:hypothetical protein